MIAHFRSLEGDLGKWTLYYFALRVDLGLIEADIIECLAGLAKN